jgi:hypothetical protein
MYQMTRAEAYQMLGRQANANVDLKSVAKRRQQIVQDLARKGTAVYSAVVMASNDLFRPGVVDLPALVIFSFETKIRRDLRYLQELAQWLYSYKNTEPADAEGQYLARLVNDERYVEYRRCALPNHLTHGLLVYAAHLMVVRSYLPGGFLQQGVLRCVAEPGPNGRIEILPQ